MVATWLLLTAAATAQGSITLNKSFSPTTIGPGSISTMTLTVSNSSGSGSRSLSVTDSLPAGMTVADPAIVSNLCGGTVSATAGGSSVSFDGSLGTGLSCSVSVNVTASGAGTYSNTANLTSDIGSDSATAVLTVDTSRPGFTKSFSPNPTNFGGRTTLTFTIDNTASSALRINMLFSDTFPSGMTVASPTNASTTCSNAALTATSGSGSVSFGSDGTSGFGANVAAGGSCTATVDVVAGAAGSLGNLSGELLTSNTSGGFNQSSGKAGATLTSLAERLALSKTFTDDPVAAGGTVSLQFSIQSLERSNTITDITFVDDLDAALSGLVAISLPSNPCGTGSSITGSSVLTLSGGTLAAGTSCTFTVGLQVPASAAVGAYTNTTEPVTGNSGGNQVVGLAASDDLFVEAAGGVQLTKTFVGNPAGAGGSTTLEFTLTNTTSVNATDITFTDVLASEYSTVSSGLGFNVCGTGSFLSATTAFGDFRLVLSGASLSAGDSCTLSVGLEIASNAAGGTYVNTTSAGSATIDGETVSIDSATDSLEIVGGAILAKSFVDDPAQPGDTVTLEFTLSQDGGEGSSTLDAITFTDDLDAVISGLAATGLPQNDVCGTGSQISGTSTLTFSGGSLAPGDVCTFSVSVVVPAGASAGVFTNTTSSVSAENGGLTVVTPPAQDDLVVSGVTFSKEFTDDPVVAGGSTTLQFTIANNGTTSATGITFSDDLGGMISGAIPSYTGGAPCGASSALNIVGDTILVSNGDLAAGASCTFEASVAVPLGTEDGTYTNVTSGLTFQTGGGSVVLDPAVADLEVNSELLQLTKEFVDDPVAPGETVTLRFTLTNLSDLDVADAAFTDDLDAALSGLTSVSATQTDVCGTGSEISGVSVLTFTGGMLSGMSTCTFDVVLTVPSVVDTTQEIVNTTSDVSGTQGGLPISGSPASDVLEVESIVFTKAFGVETAEPGDTVSLSFTIVNDGSDTASELAFTDNLDSMLSGLVATSLPAEPCGTGSTISGSGFLTFLGGTLPPGGSCTFSVDVVVPALASPGVYENVTSALRRGGSSVSVPATDTLEIVEPPPNVDSDGDGVLDVNDLCAETVIPEGVPTQGLKPNHYALVDGDLVFDTKSPPGNGNGPGDVFTTTDTGGCSCEQIIEALNLGEGHVKHGCSIGVMRVWAGIVSGSTLSFNAFGEGDWGNWTVVNGN